MSDSKEDLKPDPVDPKRHELLMQIKDHLEEMAAEFVDVIDSEFDTGELIEKYFLKEATDLDITEIYEDLGEFLEIERVKHVAK